MPRRSRRRKSTTKVNVPDHRHCEVCGKVIPVDEKYCSPKCEDKAVKERKSMERFRKIWIIILIAFTAFMVMPILLRLLGLG